MIQLEIRNLSKSFGGIEAIRELHFQVKAGEILALIGPNGAGKSTVFNCINGIYRPEGGSILFQGENIVGLKTHRIARLGMPALSRTLPFQQHDRPRQPSSGKKPLPELRHPQGRAFLRKGAAGGAGEPTPGGGGIIDFLEIERYRKTPVGALPFGVQKRVELGRALAMKPRILLLDEPVAGMNEEETKTWPGSSSTSRKNWESPS